ncbi:MAG: hypothetical protein E6J82_17485 [Deltaproteobacteria bacterium]|nr:MAG: hypothetical protein E6J82_17485 [Deltaproteobacteria bacterium]
MGQPVRVRFPPLAPSLFAQGAASVVQSRVEDLSPVVKKVSVEVTPDRVKDALDHAFTSVSRTVKLKGYRQGHVPRRLVERYFGDDVKKDVAQKLVTGSIHEALAEHQLDPVAPPRVENGSVEPGQPFKYTATVEVRPRVEPKDYEGLTVPKIEPVVTDAEIGERIEEIRSGQAMFVPVEGRDVAEAGDFVSADYEGSDPCSRTRPRVCSGRAWARPGSWVSRSPPSTPSRT